MELGLIGFGIASIYQILNACRLIKKQMPSQHLYRVVRKSALWLGAGQIAFFGLGIVTSLHDIHLEIWMSLSISLQLILATILFSSTVRHLRTTKPPILTQHYADKDLPSLTVAIPARNETVDLQECLQSLVTSNYQKLEILVLDDCSPTKRTSEIIQSFAQSGVRFIAGTPPPEEWLAKNFAYQQLGQEANGELLLFCGVDTRFEPGSLRAIVIATLQKKKSMVSLLPRNIAPISTNFGSLLVQPSRYAWELALPRRLLNRPPVLSTCWIITTALLREAGGFAAVSRSSSPESYFARRAAAKSDGYSFLQSSPDIGLTSVKSFTEQRATAIRTRYPQLHRRLELTALLSLVELGGLVLPLITTAISLFTQRWTLGVLSGAISLLLTAFYIQIVTVTYRKFLWRSLWLLPFAALYDIALLNYSMYKYEFSEVIWKGRNVCIPVMRAASSPLKPQ